MLRYHRSISGPRPGRAEALYGLLIQRYFSVMTQQDSTAIASQHRPSTANRPPRCRSAVTNGSRLHVVSPGDTAWSRRFADVLGQVIFDLGGVDLLSEGQRQLARRAATLSIMCERMEGEAAAGRGIDLDTYGQLTDRLGRAFGRLGLQRRAREVSNLQDYLVAQQQTESEGAG
jgi:hypothetical protein